MSKNLNYTSNQAFSLIIEQQVLHSTSTTDGVNRINTPADYLFLLVSYFKESSLLPKELLHHLQKLAELQEREDQTINNTTKPTVNEIPHSSLRHIKFNDLFTTDFN